MKNPRNGQQTPAAGGMPEGIDLRELTEADLEAVLRIENASYPQPWSRAMFLAEWKDKDYSKLWVAADRSTGRPVGYVCFWVLFDELHLLNVAVEPGFRNRGIGRALLRRTLEYGRERGARKAFLDVRASNAAARRLYDGFGFAVSAVRPRYYGAPVENGLEMTLEDLETNHRGGVKMGNEDKVMEELMKGSFEFRKLYREHVNLDHQVSKMTRRKVLTPEEELHRKQLQVEKLKTKDRMEDMIRERRRSGSPLNK